MDNDLEEGLEGNLAELDRIDNEAGRFLKRRMILWAIRWATGFAVIAVLVHFYPKWAWLWWVGALLAAVTPIMAFVTYVILDRKSRQARASLAGLESALDKES